MDDTIQAGAQWHSSRDARKMLMRLAGIPNVLLRVEMDRPRLNRRKIRLFLVANARYWGHRLADPRSLAAIDVAERFADGAATGAELRAAWHEAHLAWDNDVDSNPRGYARYAAHDAVGVAILQVTRPGLSPPPNEAQASILRDLFFNPYDESWKRTTCNCDRGYVVVPGKRGFRDMRRQQCGACYGRCWKTPIKLSSTVISLAQAIYEARDWDRMPFLADALEEAGNTNRHVLEHCRVCQECGGQGWLATYEPNPEQYTCDWCGGTGVGLHFRGCWVVDSILAKY